MNNLNDFEKDILSFKDEPDYNIKITPNYYIHMAILMAQRTLMISVMKTDIREGITAYSILIEHIEMLCRAAGRIGTEYDNDIETFTKSKEYNEVDNRIKMAKLSNKKLELLMKENFSRSPSTDPMRV